MKITIKEDSVAFHLLMYLQASEDLLMTAFMPPHKWHILTWCKNYNTYKTTVYRLYKKGYIEIIEKEKKKFLKLTKEGEFHLLLAKAMLPGKHTWDGKWRLIIFDIPEMSKPERNLFRKLLKQNGFIKLQASVYISPYPLNREAIVYLKETGLIKFVRILRVDEIDDDKDIKKKFSL